MDHPVPASSQGSEDVRDGSQRSGDGQGRPMRPERSAEIGSLRVESRRRSDAEDEAEDDDGFDSEEFRQWMRDRSGRARRSERPRRRESSVSSDGDGGSRTNAGPAPEWDGESLGFQDYVIKARLWLATTRSKPRTRGPLLLSKLSKTPFETMKFLAKDAVWMQNPNNGEELINMMDQSEYFGDDRDEDLLSALAKITYHVRREKSETHRAFFNRWEAAQRKVLEHKVQLPEKYTGFLLIQALCLSEQEIKSMLNYTRGSILTRDIKEYVQKHETKLQVSQVGIEKKTSSTGTSGKTNSNYLLNDEDTDVEDEEIYALETALRDLHDGESAGDLSAAQEDEAHVLEEHEAAEILSTMLTKKRSFVQSQKAKKAKELGRGYHQPPKGRGKSFSTTTSGRQPFRSGQYKMTIEEVKKVTKCGHCHKVGHWHRECPDLHRGSHEKEQHWLETEEATFCGLLENDENQMSPIEDYQNLHPPEDELTGPETSFPSCDTAPGSVDVETTMKSGGVGTVMSERDSFKPMSPYNDRSDDGWEVFLGERDSGIQNGFMNSNDHDPKLENPLEATCATVDTGCQRMAIGVETLKRLAKHLPKDLPVHLQHQEHRFRFSELSAQNFTRRRSQQGPRKIAIPELPLTTVTNMMESERKRSRPVEQQNPGLLVAWYRIMLKLLFTMSRVSNLAQRLLRPGRRLPTEHDGNPTSRTSRRGTPSRVTEEFEVISWQSGRASSNRMSSAPSQASTITGQDLVTDQVLRMVGPPLQCEHHETTKLYICRKQGNNYKRLFWRCPRQRDDQCHTFVWCKIQPYLDPALQNQMNEIEEMDDATNLSSPRTESQRSAASILEEAQRRCPHKNVTKSGSNPYQKQEKCSMCGKILKIEKTALGLQKEQEKMKKALQPTYKEYLEWKKAGCLEPGGVWTDKGPGPAACPSRSSR
eukprot:s90_g59.t1